MKKAIMNIEKQKEIKERVNNLYSDWLSTKKTHEIREIKESLKEASQPGGAKKFKTVVESMGSDGQTLAKIYTESWTAFGDSPIKAKYNLMKTLFKATPSPKVVSEAKKENNGSVQTEIGMSYYPVADGSNQMQSVIDPSDRDLIIQIRHAITGGNMTIAAELLQSGYGSLSLKERNSLIDFVNSMSGYNISVPGAEELVVPKNRGTVMKKLEKRSDTTKQDYIDGLTMTAIENMKVN